MYLLFAGRKPERRRAARHSACAALCAKSNRLSRAFDLDSASPNRMRPERTRPSYSAASGASRCNEPAATRLSSAEGILVADNPDLRLFQHTLDERVLLAAKGRDFELAVDDRVDLASERSRCRLQRAEQIREGQCVAHDEQIDVARRVVLPL